MSADRLVLVSVGYAFFTVPESVLPLIPSFRPVERDYKIGSGYVYTWDHDAEVEVRVVDANKIGEKPPKEAPAVPEPVVSKAAAAVVPLFDRQEEAPAAVQIPSTRDFVDGFRDGEDVPCAI